MKAATLNELQKELTTLPPKSVLEICARLIKYKKENKELLTYLLFEADDEEAYKKGIKEEVDAQFEDMNKSNLYLAKKTIRKVLRTINKYIRYSGSKQTEAELRIYYCIKLKESGIRIENSQVLKNLYDNQRKKIEAALSKIHEDLQLDYKRELEELETYH
jgi:predicted CopG family antitoxin